VAGVRAVYDEVLAAVRARRQPGQAIVAMGHCYMVKSEVSELSERRILGGNQHALPLDLFPDDVAYVALGHLHKPQRLGSDRVRYSGSPLPLSMGERTYQHQVSLVELSGEALVSVESLLVPRVVELVRVPRQGALPPDELLAELRKLPPRGDLRDCELPFLEVEALLAEPDPGLPARVEAALEGRAARLVRLGRTRTGSGGTLAEQAPAQMLDALTPDQVFADCYERAFAAPPPDDLVAAFHELLDAVHQEKNA